MSQYVSECALNFPGNHIHNHSNWKRWLKVEKSHSCVVWVEGHWQSLAVFQSSPPLSAVVQIRAPGTFRLCCYVVLPKSCLKEKAHLAYLETGPWSPGPTTYKLCDTQFTWSYLIFLSFRVHLWSGENITFCCCVCFWRVPWRCAMPVSGVKLPGF